MDIPEIHVVTVQFTTDSVTYPQPVGAAFTLV
jgi:hypothetical protein